MYMSGWLLESVKKNLIIFLHFKTRILKSKIFFIKVVYNPKTGLFPMTGLTILVFYSRFATLQLKSSFFMKSANERQLKFPFLPRWKPYKVIQFIFERLNLEKYHSYVKLYMDLKYFEFKMFPRRKMGENPILQLKIYEN